MFSELLVQVGDFVVCRLGIDDVDEIVVIEEDVYSHPWTRGNFVDTFNNPHEAFGLRDFYGKLVGYFLLAPVVDELHLLTFAVARDRQGQGLAFLLLQKMQQFAKISEFESILLEVRVSNLRAIDIYHRFGFNEIGRRKAYYPAHNQTKEDAIVMRLMCH
jgi:ribosomal-protein-alanine N-acetyltransferase